ncbi:MAG: response regulator, partial [Deltaproteobacteria bacterium]|nr:response regulator [Deltaproteobacteria bacterium]
MAPNILLVDDEGGIRNVLGISLADKGYEVATAENGREALQLFKEKKPPIVLTDIKMPGMDGIELLQKIKAMRSDTEVIMITGHGDMELAIQSLKFDATDFISKPINDDVLEIALKRANERITFRAKLKEYTENLEYLVEEKTKKLVAAERLAAVGQTVAGLAHAVKNMAGGLKGGAFVLEKGIELNNNEYLHQGWGMVKGNVVKIRDMALDLLSYAKEREPDYRLCDPNEPARQVVDFLRSRASECGIAFEMKLDETLPHVWLDVEGIHRCLLNLATNAMDACTDIECIVEKKKVLLRSLKR